MSRFKALNRALRSFGCDDEGSVYTFVGLGMFAMIGFAALAIDMTNAYALRGSLQNAADAAALAAATALPDESATKSRATEYAAKNLPTEDYGNVVTDENVVIGNWDESTRTFNASGTPINAVQVTARMTEANGNEAPTYFARAFGVGSVDITAQSTATFIPGQPGCVLAVDPTNTNKSLEFNSIDSVELFDCVPAANGTSGDAIYVNSIGSFHAGSLYSVGGVSIPGYLEDDLDEPPQTGQPPVADPYGGLPNPSFGSCNWNNHSAGSSISPGVYCGGLYASGSSLTVQPGTYYIVDGDLDFNSINSITCNCSNPGDGVTFVLAGTTPGQIGTFDFNSINTVSLQAPSDPSYDFPGMLVYVDRRASFAESRFNSIDNLTFNGAVYAPSQDLNFNSIDYTTQTDCQQIIGYNVSFNSIDGFGRADNCPAYGAQNLSLGSNGLRLVN